MSKVFEMAFELSGKVSSSLKSAFKSIQGDTKSLNEKLADLEKTRGNTKRFEGLRKDILKTNREYQVAQQNVNRLAKEISNTSNPTKKLQGDFQKAQKQASNLKHRLDEQKGTLRDLKQNLDQAGISTQNFSQDQAKLEKTLARVSKAQANYNKSKSKLENAKQNTAEARGRLLDAVGMAGTLAAPVKIAIDAENTMSDVKKVVDFEDALDIKKMENKIRNITKEIPMSFTEIGNIIAAGGQAGIAKVDLPEFAIDASKMGVAFDIGAEEAGQTMAEWRSAFKMDQSQVRTLADKVNYLGNITAASAPKISEVVTRIGPLGEVSGVASGEIAAMGATLVGMGISEEIAATGIKNLMLTMSAGEGATKKQAKAFESLGLDAKGMAKKMQTDSKGAILDLLNALKKVPEHARAAKLQELVGKESIGAIAPLLNNLEELEVNFNAVDEAQRKFAGSMQSEFDAKADTTQNKLILLNNAIQDMGKTVGDILLPVISDVAIKLGEGAVKVSEFAEKHPKLTYGLVMATAAFLAFNIALIGGVYVGSLLKQSYLTVGTGLDKLKLYWAEGKIQAMAHTAATKASAAAHWIYAQAVKAVQLAQAAFNAIISTAKIIAQTVATYALIAAKWAYSAALKVVQLAQLAFDAVISTVKIVAQTAATYALTAAKMAYAGVVQLITIAQGALNAVMAAFPGFLIIAAIVAVIAAGVALYKNWDIVKEKLGQLWAWFSEKFPGMASFASSAASVIKSTFGGAINWVKDKVAALGDAWNKVKGAFGGGGKSSGGGGSTPSLPGYATGGIVTSPQIAWVGEGGSAEAIIPLEKTANSIGLWQQTGKMLGMDLGARGNKNSNGLQLAARHSDNKENLTVKANSENGNKYDFTFHIDARGASDGVEQNIEDSILQKVIPIVMRTIDQRDRDRKRLEIK